MIEPRTLILKHFPNAQVEEAPLLNGMCHTFKVWDFTLRCSQSKNQASRDYHHHFQFTFGKTKLKELHVVEDPDNLSVGEASAEEFVLWVKAWLEGLVFEITSAMDEPPPSIDKTEQPIGDGYDGLLKTIEEKE